MLNNSESQMYLFQKRKIYNYVVTKLSDKTNSKFIIEASNLLYYHFS
jgi:type IV secretory pathway VirB6-like protein